MISCPRNRLQLLTLSSSTVVPLPDISLEVKTRAVSAGGGGKKVEVFAECLLSEKVPKKTQVEIYWVIDGKEIQIQTGKKVKTKYDLKELEEGFKAGTTVSIQYIILIIPLEILLLLHLIPNGARSEKYWGELQYVRARHQGPSIMGQ